MSRRLVLAFVAVTLSLTVLVVLVRSVTLAAEVREQEAAHVTQEARLLGEVLRERAAAGEPVDREVLDGYVGADSFITVSGTGAEPVTVTGPGFDPATELDGAVSSYADLEPGRLEVGQTSARWRGMLGLDPPSLVMLLVLVALGAAAAGYAMSRWLSTPFTRLAAAAGMLGRGRFDLDLPRSRIPEAQTVTSALQASAGALRDRLSREQRFSTHASHVLRTPLTGLRLHLDELDGRVSDPESRTLLAHCQRSVDQLDQVATDLVDISRHGSLMAGSEVPLRDLATTAAQRWADTLVPKGRPFSAAVEGDLDLVLTPGPVEYVLDVLLERVESSPGAGPVRLVLLGRPEVLQADVSGLEVVLADPTAEPVLHPEPALCRVEQAASLVRSLGGRFEAPSSDAVRVLMPTR